jgi:hypothetical protein
LDTRDARVGATVGSQEIDSLFVREGPATPT